MGFKDFFIILAGQPRGSWLRQALYLVERQRSIGAAKVGLTTLQKSIHECPSPYPTIHLNSLTIHKRLYCGRQTGTINIWYGNQI